MTGIYTTVYRDRMNEAHRYFEELAEQLTSGYGGDWGMEYVGISALYRIEAEEMWKSLGEDCEANELASFILKPEEIHRVPRFPDVSTFEQLLPKCQKTVLRLWLTGRLFETANLLRMREKYIGLSIRFDELSKQCEVPVSNLVDKNGEIIESFDMSGFSNPLRAVVCSFLGKYFREHAGPITIYDYDDIFVYDYPIDRRNYERIQNSYLNNWQRVADDLSIAEKAILASDILYYATGAFLFV